jgi:GTP cyclohydrolase I
MAYKKTEQYEDEITSGLVKSYGEVLGLLGEDPEREGLKKTPERLAKRCNILRKVIILMQEQSSIQRNFMKR